MDLRSAAFALSGKAPDNAKHSPTRQVFLAKLLGDLLGGGGQASEDQAAGEQAEEEEKPEDDLENVLKKLFDR